MDEQRVISALENAEEAFWAEIAKAFPEAQSGDLDPLTLTRLAMHMRQVVDEWILLNVDED